MYHVNVFDKQARSVAFTVCETWAEVVQWLDQYQNAAEVIVENDNREVLP